MEAHVRAPDPLPQKEQMDKAWRLWKQQFLIFLKAAGFDEKPSDVKAFFLQNNIGDVGIQAMQVMDFENEEDKADFEVLLKKFDEYFDPPKKEIEERHKFYTRSKKNNESIEAYITDLKEKAKTCNFGDLTESLVRDMVILDIKDKHLRKIMFEEKNLDLNKMTLIYRQYELNTEKMKDVTKKVTSEKSSDANNKKDSHQQGVSGNKNPNACCHRCGTTHPPKNCPAFRNICEKCKEKGHFAQRCKSKNTGNNNDNKNVNTPQNAPKNKNYTKNPFSQIEKTK